MQKYFLKYAILLLLTVLYNTSFSIYIYQFIQLTLLKYGYEIEKVYDISNLLYVSSLYIINIIITVIMFLDLRKHNIKGLPVLALTVLSYFAGILFFLFLINTKTSENDN